jgi:hypothetical protein
MFKTSNCPEHFWCWNCLVLCLKCNQVLTCRLMTECSLTCETRLNVRAAILFLTQPYIWSTTELHDTVKKLSNGFHDYNICIFVKVENSPTVGSVTTSEEDKRQLAINSWEFNLSDRIFNKLFPHLVKVKQHRNVVVIIVFTKRS